MKFKKYASIGSVSIFTLQISCLSNVSKSQLITIVPLYTIHYLQKINLFVSHAQAMRSSDSDDDKEKTKISIMMMTTT